MVCPSYRNIFLPCSFDNTLITKKYLERNLCDNVGHLPRKNVKSKEVYKVIKDKVPSLFFPHLQKTKSKNIITEFSVY